MLIPCLDPNFAAHLNAFWRESITGTREFLIGLNAATIVLLLFATAVISFIVAVSGDLARTLRDVWRESQSEIVVLLMFVTAEIGGRLG